MNCFVPLYAATAHNLSQGANTHPLPQIGDVKRYLIRQRPHFIADFLIRSIIRTRLFNEYSSNSTITRLFNDYNGTESYKTHVKHKTPLQKRSAAGFVYAQNGKSLDFKRFSGIEKVHRNSIKITVDLWWS